MQLNTMGRVKHLLPLLALLTLSPLGATAQRGGLLGRSELVMAGGIMSYLGDLNNQSAFGEIHPAAGAGLRCRLDNRWSVRLQGSYGTISAMTDCIESRNLSFRSRLSEAALLAEFDFRPYGSGATESQWTPYIFGGLAVFHYNPETQYTDMTGTVRWAYLQPLHTEGQGTAAYPDRHPYTLTQLSLPFGVGLRCRLGKNLSLTAEYGFRKTWTDYLDDVSTTYVGADLLQSEVEEGGLAARLADRSTNANAVGIKRGDDSLDDWYSYLNLSLGINMEMLFGWLRSKKCRN